VEAHRVVDRRMSVLAASLVSVLVSLMIASCGGTPTSVSSQNASTAPITTQQNSGTPQSTTTTGVDAGAPSDLVRSATEFENAFFGNDAAVSYRYLTDSCRGKVDQAQWATQLQSGLTELSTFTKTDLTGASVDSIRFDHVTGSSAKETLVLRLRNGQQAALPQGGTSWTKEQDGWHIPACD